MWLRSRSSRRRAPTVRWAYPQRLGLLRGLALVLATPALLGSLAHGAPPASPPSPRVSLEDGLAISRRAGADRRLGKFSPRSDGGYDYDDPKARFSAHIAADGRVTFRGAAQVSKLSLAQDRHGGIPLRGIGGYLLDPTQWRREVSPNDLGSALHGGVADPMTQHLSTVEKTETMLPGQMFWGIGGRFGRSVFSDRVKAEFLRDTFELRLGLAVEAEGRRLARALGELEGQLHQLWSTPSFSAEERRRLLFELWDECDERLDVSEAALTDDLRVDVTVDERRQKAAVEARWRIQSFIRLTLPAGSKLGYSREELQRLNRRRRSRESFDPYGREQSRQSPSRP